MLNDVNPAATAPATRQWKPNVIYPVLAEPARRAVLFALATGQAKPASPLTLVVVSCGPEGA